jgi:PadR family transcriptional regulator, regulatory protein PadR
MKHRYKISIAASMAKNRTELVKGTLDLMILRTLELRPTHGVAIAERIDQITRGTFQVKAGSLFPALHRLEQRGWIAGEWTESAEKRRVKSYVLTPAGQKQLDEEKAEWQRVVAAMGQLLESS